jgi:hypothetical protein
VFQVTLRYSGQPDWAAGEYPTREAAAQAAAELYVTEGPTGERPIGVGIMRTHVPNVARPPVPPLPLRTSTGNPQIAEAAAREAGR